MYYRTMYSENDTQMSCINNQLMQLQEYDLELVKNPDKLYFIKMKTKCLYNIWRYNHINYENDSYKLVLKYVDKTLDALPKEINILKMKAEILNKIGEFYETSEVYDKILCIKSSNLQKHLFRIKEVLNNDISEVRTLNQYIQEIIYNPVLIKLDKLNEKQRLVNLHLLEDVMNLLYFKVKNLVDKAIEYKNNNQIKKYKNQVKKLYKIEKDILPIVFSGIVNVGNHEDGDIEEEVYYNYVNIYEELFKVFYHRKDIVDHLIYVHYITEPEPSYAPIYYRVNELLDECIEKSPNDINYYIQKCYLLDLQLLPEKIKWYYEKALKINPQNSMLILLRKRLWSSWDELYDETDDKENNTISDSSNAL